MQMGEKMDTHYLGKDIAFDADGDLMVTPIGDVAVVSGVDCLLQDVQDRLRTLPSDLWKHPEFGCDANRLLGAPDTPLNLALAQRAIRIAMEDEPRIDPKTLQIKADRFSSEEKVFTIQFRSKGSDTQQKLVVGFGLKDMTEVAGG